MIDALDPRKMLILRKARRRQRVVLKSTDIKLDGLLDQQKLDQQPLTLQPCTLQPPRDVSEIHFLPLPSQLAQLLPQAEQQATLLDRAEQKTISTTILKAELDAFKKDLHAEIDLCNADMIALKDCVVAMEEEIADIRRRVFRLKMLAVGGCLFLVAWAFALNLLF